MKKLYLLLDVGISLSSAAQTSETTGAASQQVRAKGMIERRKAHATNPPSNYTMPSMNTANKSAGPDGVWYCFSDAIFIQGTSDLSYWPVYPDSNIYTGNFHWYMHAFGTSMDPKSAKFYNNFANSNPYYPQPTLNLTAGDPYWVDSVGIIGWYERIDFSVTDKLHLYVVNAPAQGTFNVTWSYTDNVAPYWGRPDSALQVAEPKYDWTTNSLNVDSIPGLIHIVKDLDDAAYADSTYFAPDNTYLHVWNFDLPGAGINVPAGGNMIALVTFESAVNHPLGTDWNLANKWTHLTEAVQGQNGIPNQVVGDYNGGLAAFGEERFHFGNYYSLNNGSAVLAPTYAWTPVYMSDPWFAFHLRTTTSVENTSKAQAELKMYPNPANDKITVELPANQVGRADVVITDVTGKLVATNSFNIKNGGTTTFSTANFPNGTYFCTVHVNGTKASSKFVVNR